MGQALNSIDNMIRSAADAGMLTRFFADTVAATTAATVNSGLNSAAMFPNAVFTVPQMGANVASAKLTFFEASLSTGAGAMVLCCAIFPLGTLAVATGTFTQGQSMPIRLIGNSQIQLVSEHTFLFASAALTATTPTITITYTNQDGTTGRTATMTFPTSPAINSVFFVDPHLQANDMGIMAVSNITKSAGTVGTLVCYGALVLGYSMSVANFSSQSPSALTLPKVAWPLVVGDQIAFVKHGLATASDLIAGIGLLADN